MVQSTKSSSKTAPFLVTGAAGFTGSNLVRLLLARDVPVRVLVRDSAAFAKLGFHDVEVVEGDLKDRESIRSAVGGCSGVYHIAALFRRAGVPDSEYLEVNLEGTRRLIDAAVEFRVPRFIYCSTIGVQGHIVNPPATETHPYNPGDLYQQSKMEAELLALRTFKEGRLKGVVIRPAMIYGPGDTRTLKIFSMLARGRFFYVGKGDQYVHFVDVRDLVEAFATAMNRSDLNGEVYTIAGRTAMPLKEALRVICEKLRVKPPWLHLPVKPMQWLGDICEALCKPLRINPPLYRRRVDFYTKNRNFDCSKAARDLGYAPRRSFNEEISQIVDWYKAHGMLGAPAHVSSTMVRSLDGKISDWDQRSEHTYGWSKELAVGKVSHNLLQTEFPCSLDEINRQLVTNKVWEGPLVHTRRDGNRVKVASRWEIQRDTNGDEFRVIETNLPHDDSNPAGQPIGMNIDNLIAPVMYSFTETAGFLPQALI